MANVRKIHNDPEYKHYYLVDSNFLANKFIPAVVAPAGREKDRVVACAALAALVERIAFNPTNGTGRVSYRVGLSGAKFDVQAAARGLGTGVMWCPHGERRPLYIRYVGQFPG